MLYFAFHGILFFFSHGWGFVLQAMAIIHFIRRRPDTYWLFIILFRGWLGALVYIVAEVIPDAGLLRTNFQVFPRRRRIRELERAILDNPSAGNYEELGLLYLDDGDFTRPAPPMTRPFRREPTQPTPSIAAAWLKSNWETSPRPSPTSSVLLRRSRL